MRIAFGLVSLLVVLGIIMLLFSTYQAPMLKKGKRAQDDARQIAGRDENNAPVTDAVTLDAQDRNGRMVGAVVANITPGSTLQNHYGLQKGDVIMDMGPLSVKDHMGSPSEARDFLLDAYQKQQPLVVMRGWERLTLPLDPAVAAAAPAAPSPTAPVPGTDASAPAASPPSPDASPAATQQPQQPANKPPQKKPGGLEGQLDAIRNYGQ